MGESVLLGQFEHRIDDKGRLNIPAQFRKKLDDNVVVSKGFDGCLVLRSYNHFLEWQNSILSQSEHSKDVRILQRQVLSNSSETKFDTVGRINISKKLLDLADIKKDVIVVGLGNKIEIWDRDKWDEFTKISNEVLEEIAEKVG